MLSTGTANYRKTANQNVSLRSGHSQSSHDLSKFHLSKLDSEKPPTCIDKSSAKIFSFRRAFTLFLICWSFVTAGVVGRRKLLEHDAKIAATARMDPQEASIPWSSNANVFASTTQNDLAYFYKSYTSQLCNLLDDDRISGFGHAQSVLESGGLSGIYRLDPQFPVSTPRRYGAWDKRVDRERYALMITGDDSGRPSRNILSIGDERIFSNQVKNLSANLKRNFGLSDSDISHLRQPRIKDIEIKLKALSKELDPDTELLIYIAAHGDKVADDYSSSQGSNTGLLYMQERECLQEPDLKELIQRNFSHLPNVTIIIDSCYSGSFIS